MRALVVVIAILAGGCSAAADPPPVDPSGTWELVAGRIGERAVPIVEGYPITIIVDARRISGTAGCNGYGADVRAHGESIAVDELTLTAALCDIRGVMEAESAYVGALQRISAVGIDGGALVLSGPDTELRFERLPDAPADLIANTAWVLESLFVGDVAGPPLGEPATLRLDEDGTFAGSTGCRSFSGTWVVEGNQISASSMAMDDANCPAGLTAQDSHVVEVIGDGFVPSIDGGLLTLTDPGSIGLVYRAGE